MRVMINDGWKGTGKKGSTVGDDVRIKNVWFTPVMWDDDIGVSFVKTVALCVEAAGGKPCKHQSRVIEVEVCPKCGEVLSDVPQILGLRKKNPFKKVKL